MNWDIDAYDHIPHLTLAEITVLAHCERCSDGVTTYVETRRALGWGPDEGNLAFKALEGLATCGRVLREPLEAGRFPDEPKLTRYQWRLTSEGRAILARARSTISTYVAKG